MKPAAKKTTSNIKTTKPTTSKTPAKGTKNAAPKKKDAGQAKPNKNSAKKVDKPKKKKEEFKIMSLEQIEELFEKKTESYHAAIKEYTAQKSAMKPLTLKLICRHAYPQPEYPTEVMEAAKENQSDSSSYQSLDEADKEAIVIE